MLGRREVRKRRYLPALPAYLREVPALPADPVCQLEGIGIELTSSARVEAARVEALGQGVPSRVPSL